METRTNLKQARHSAANLNMASGRLGDAAQYFEQGALARSVAANDPYDLTLTDFEADILQRPELLLFRAAVRPWAK